MYIACVTCFVMSRSKKAMTQFQMVLGMISTTKQQDTRVSYNEDGIIKNPVDPSAYYNIGVLELL